MTSVPLADKRPPHLRPPPPNLPGPATALGFGLSQTRPHPTGLVDVDDRATKRRKVDGSVPAENGAPAAQPIANLARTIPKYTNPQDLRLLAAVIAANANGARQERKDVGLPEMPQHPWNNKDSQQKKPSVDTRPTHRSRPTTKVPCTPDTLKTPQGGPVLVNDRPAGYFPWGARPSAEDQLSEVNVKQGYYDRPPNPPEKELNTARVPLYHAFKHRSGVESLSTIFSIILEAKSKHNMLSSASAFKPPPRVTLSEPKKKTWIGELADPAVPLKKLSRTIPQGIRGQGLLEQCLQNNVPLSRAIWFVKCVGANEIRTLKRKGTTQAAAVGGERNWLKDWTVNVEQYVEAVLNQNGQTSWKQNLQYALRLTTRLYLENLIDRDHFLDWIVNTFATTTNDRLPFWLMMTHVFKQDIAKFRKRGRRLAEMLLRRYLSLKDSTHAMVQTTLLKIKDAIRGFAIHRPQLFLAPDSWPELKSALRSCLHDQNALELRLYHRLDLVNERCMGASKQQYLAKPVPRDSVVGVLDAAKPPYNVDSISQTLFSHSADYSVLVSAVAEWATTIYRCGTERVYLASRILRKWQKSGPRIDAAILDFVAKCHSSPELFDSAALKHLAAELSRSRAFPSSKYMQWLSVRGLPWPKSVSVSDQPDPQDPNRRYTRQICKDGSLLLADLLFSEPDSHHLNLRNSLLSRAGFDIEREVQSTQRLQATIRTVLQQVDSNETYVYSPQRLTTILKDWNWRVRSALAHHLRGFVVAKVKQQTALRQRGGPPQKEFSITLRHFEFVRTCLEALGDEAVLADIVGLCSQTYDEALQAALANTLYRHAGPFSAIGALESLQARLCQNYRNLRNVTMPLFATALLDLCTAYPCKMGSVKLFQQDLIFGDRSRAIAACSPFSDGVAESLQNAEETFIDDFEAVLQSEPSMTEQTMSRLFMLLAEKIEKQSQSIDGRLLFTYCQLMARLRLCRKVQGDQLLQNWLVKLLSTNPTGFAQILVSNLIDVGALTVTALVDAFGGHRLAAQILQHTFPDRLPEQRYSVLSKWRDFAQQSPDQLLNLTSQVPRTSGFNTNELCVNAVLKSDASLSKPAEAQLKRNLNETICRGNGGDVSTSLEAMDVFSLPFVRFHLQLSATTGNPDTGLADAIVNAAAKGSIENIAKLLQATGPELASQVRQMLDDNMMEMLPLASQGKLLDVSLDPERMERLQIAVDQAFLLFPPNSSPSPKNTAHLIEKLQQFLKFLGSPPAAAQAGSPSAVLKQAVASPKTPATPSLTLSVNTHLQPASPMAAVLHSLPNTIIDYFQILLNLLCLQRPTNASTLKDVQATGAVKPQPSRPEYVKILAYVAHIATHPAFLLPQLTFPDSPKLQHRARETVDFAYDVMATYVDDLSEDNRVTTAKILRDRLNSIDTAAASTASSTTNGTIANSNGPAFAATRESQARLRWLFGSVNAMGSDLPNAGEMGSGLLVQQKRGLDGSVRNVSGTGAVGTPSTPTVGGFTGMPGVEAGKGATLQQQNEKTITMDWRPRVWEVLESQGRPDGETSLGLGLFATRRPWPSAWL